MNITELEKQLKVDGIKPVYLVCGQEPFFRGEAIRLLKEAAAREKPPRDVSEMEGLEVEARKLLDDLRTPSLFAPSRLAIVADAEALFGAAMDLLASYARNPPSRTALVLVAEEFKPRDPKKRATRKKKSSASEPAAAPAASGQTFLKHVVHVECAPLKNRYALQPWIVARAKFYGKPIQGDAATSLADFVGSSLGQLDGKLQMLAAYCRERPAITADDVAHVTAGDHARTIWDLIEAIEKQAAPAALIALNRLVQHGDMAPQQVLVFIERELRMIHAVARLARERQSAAQIAQAVRKPPFVVTRALGLARALGSDGIRARFRLLIQADVDLKSSAGEKSWIMEQLILRLCGAAPAR